MIKTSKANNGTSMPRMSSKARGCDGTHSIFSNNLDLAYIAVNYQHSLDITSCYLIPFPKEFVHVLMMFSYHPALMVWRHST